MQMPRISKTNRLTRIIWHTSGILAAALLASAAFAQRPCPTGVHIEGIVTDPTGAVIPGAQIQAADSETATTDTSGHFALTCVPAGSDKLIVQADGFTSATAPGGKRAGETANLALQLTMAQVTTDVQVTDDPTAMDPDHGAGTTIMDTKAVQQLADDPDDFLRQLQVLAAGDGGDPSSTLITVDGFQNGSALPPKSSIASIRINPDLFSSQYYFPPFDGGLIEIFTKPGADSIHGALFYTGSPGAFNATDPFSTTATPASKKRYGFELSGPIIPKKSGFSLALEKRDINEFNVVNATTLDANGNPAPFQQTVAAPQRLWIASARGDWQVTPKDVAVLAFAANVNNLGNQGVGGLVLPEAGYSNLVSEYDLRFSNTLTLNPNLLHETRIGYTWKRNQQTPNSTDPSQQVNGYFVGGGATTQNLNDRERDLEIDDDVMLTRGKHSFKFGAQSLGIFVHDYDPDTFNGAYVFGGGIAPVLDANNNPTGQTTTISGIQQYQRALQNLPGGSPTTYQLTSGNPLVPLTQWKLGLYAQDDIKLAPRFTLSTGLRYQFQTTPNSFLNLGPRLSLSWSPDKKQTWVLRARGGLFHNSPQGPSYATEVYRLNGVRQQQTTVYSPSYSNPLTPIPGSIAVSTINTFPPSLSQQSTFAGLVSVEHDFPRHWHSEVHFYWGEDWDNVFQRNINAPLVASNVGNPPDPTAALLAPRPIAPNENIMQFQNAGHLAGNVVSLHLEQHSFKRFTISAHYRHMNFKSDTHDGVGPQSSYTNAGESARVDWLRENGGSVFGNLTLPWKIDLSTQCDAYQGAPYNITTGTDNNGDGDFNDRPSYAIAPGAGVYSTPYGLLTANTVNGNVPRNIGTMPGTVHLDMNLSRVFQLNAKTADHPRTLTFNARSANLLNHSNVIAVGTVLSPTVGQPISAEAARRIEIGARLSF
jgi:hypothetical protein